MEPKPCKSETCRHYNPDFHKNCKRSVFMATECLESGTEELFELRPALMKESKIRASKQRIIQPPKHRG